MRLYNTLTRQIDEFVPIEGSQVKMYTCGPTVYDTQTIGNWTAYIRWDILARTLQFAGYDLNWVMNITDVGHLVSDGDTGEDKLEKGAKREGISAWDVARKYTEEFTRGLDQLNISIPRDHIVKATDHIREQIELIVTLEKKGHTYTIEDGVYFDSTTFPDYGKMAKLDIKGQKAGARVEIGNKKHSSDFALWKFSPKDATRDMEWDSPWGKGFPGWHIECSAMAMKYLGRTLDIHTGGIDHIPVHHTNEIAQSEAATGVVFARFWLHSNFLQIDGQKISKSLGNFFTLADLLKKGFLPTDLRVFVLQSLYRSEANFTWEDLESAKQRRVELQALADLRFQASQAGLDVTAVIKQKGREITSCLQDNLNTPQVLAHLSELANELSASISTTSNDELRSFLGALDAQLGLNLLGSADITSAQKKQINDRESARADKNWQLADQIRNKLINTGITLLDTESGPVWQRT